MHFLKTIGRTLLSGNTFVKFHILIGHEFVSWNNTYAIMSVSLKISTLFKCDADNLNVKWIVSK